MAGLRLIPAAVRIALAIGAGALWSTAATFREDFSQNPRPQPWQTFGQPSLFSWNPTNQNLEVTWDSAFVNSGFWVPLGTVLTIHDDFQCELDLHLADVASGVNPEKPFTFELAFGLVNVGDVTDPDFRRGVGVHPIYGPRNLVEFDYFPDSGYGATIWPALLSTNGQFNYYGFGDYVLAEMTSGTTYHVRLEYQAATRELQTTVDREGQPFATHATRLTSSFSDWRLNAFAVCSYSDAGASGSLLAHGTIDNLVLTVPDPPISRLSASYSNGIWQVAFSCRSNWQCTLLRSPDYHQWTAITSAWVAAEGPASLSDPAAPERPAQFYRVEATRP